jgi:tetratricopeptide (TPR) repeat protein
MTPARRSVALPAFAALLLLAAAAQPAWAGWQEDYKEGVAMLQEKKFKKAENLLRAAIDSKFQEKANAIKASGMFFEPYLPHFYLGLTLFQQQSYEEAIQELERSESMGVVTKDATLSAQLTQTKQIARQLAESGAAQSPQPPPSAPASVVAEKAPPGPEKSGEAESGESKAGGAAPATPPPAPQPPAPSRPSGGKATKAEPLTPPKPTGPDPALVRAIDAAAGDIAAAQKLKATAGDDLNATEKARLDSAATALREAASAAVAKSRHEDLKKLTAEYTSSVEKRRSDRAAGEALAQARKAAGATLATGKSFLSQNGGKLLNSEKSTLTGAISSIEKAGSAEAVRAAAQGLDRNLSSIRGALAQRAAAPPPADDARARQAALAAAKQSYSEGVTAYFKGDYDDAVRGLMAAGDGIGDDPEIHAMLGSALYKKYILTRSKDGALKARAEEAFRTALSIKPGYRLDTRYYPPKVISFFGQVASGAASPAGPAGQ